MAKIVGDVGIGWVVDELVTFQDAGAAYDNDVEDFARLGFIESVGDSAGSVTGSKMRDEGCTAEADFVAVMQDAVDVRGRIPHGFVVAESEISVAARFDSAHVGIHDEVFCVSLAQDGCTAGGVVRMRVADEKDFDVAEVKAEGFDTVLDLRGRSGEVAVDEDVSLRRDNEEGG